MPEKDGLHIPFNDKKEPEKIQTEQRTVKKRFRVPITALFGFLCCIGVIGVIFWLNQKTEDVSLLGNLQPSYFGYNGTGTIEGEFHPEQSGLADLEEFREDWESSKSRNEAYQRLIESIKCSFSKTDELSNGEQITYACTYDKAAAEEAHIVIGQTEKKYTVNGLAEYRELNIFEGIEMYWKTDASGISLELEIPSKLTDLGISYVWEYGDSVKPVIRLIASYDEEKLKQKGYIVRESVHEFPVDRKPQRLNDPSQLSNEEKEVLTANLMRELENELEQCGQITINNEPVQISNIRLESFKATIGSYFDPDNVQFIVTYRMDTDYPGMFSEYRTYEASYRITVYRLADNSVTYYRETTHGCYFSGFFGLYTLVENN